MSEIVENLRFQADAMYKAPSGIMVEGTFHVVNWNDKPHRVLYDACILIEEAAEYIEQLEQAYKNLKEKV